MLEHYPHLNKYCKEEYKTKLARTELEIQARLDTLEILLQEKRMLPDCPIPPPPPPPEPFVDPSKGEYLLPI
jgi:hypothetical protein